MMTSSLLLAMALQSLSLLAPERFRTGLPEYGLSEGPGGVYLTRSTGPWGKSEKEEIWVYPLHCGTPARASWSSDDASESDFYFDKKSATGYFISDHDGGADIWRIKWRDGQWGEAEKLPTPVNSEDAEYSPVIRNNGQLCFASARSGGKGQGDLYCASELQTAEWRVEPLDELNSPGSEWNLGFSADGDTVIFEASGRSTNKSVPGDLYLSRDTQNGWSSPTPLSRLNTTGSELMPRFLANGSLSYASSNGDDADILFAATDDLNVLAPSLAAVARSSGEIVLLDPATLSESTRIHVGTGPHDIAASADGRIAIVPLLGVFPEPHEQPIDPSQLEWRNEVSEGYALVDLVTGDVVKHVLEDCPRPHGAAIAAQGQIAWITCETAGEIREINPVTGELLRAFKTGAGVHKVMLLERKGILAGSNPDTGEAYLIDLKSGEIHSFKTGRGAEALAAARDEATVWVANSFDKTVCSIDVTMKTMGRCMATGGAFPIALAVDDEREKIWVLRNASSDLVSLSLLSGDVIDEIALTSRPLGMAFDAANNRLYVTLPRRNEVFAIDANTGELSATAFPVMEGDDLDLIPLAEFASPPDT